VPIPLDYVAVRRRPRRRLVAVGIAVLSLASVLGVGSVLLPSMNRTTCCSNRLRCASNLRQIGQGIQMYANENRGSFPDDFAVLLLTQDLTSYEFVCGASNDTWARGPTTQAVAANLTAGGHLSYVYTGKGMSLNSPASAVIAYEPLANHGDGMNVLFADGHVQWMDAKRGQALLAELQSGHNPPQVK
jgi:prepilin-type processing-associated H-X9-DG protein